MPGTITDPFTEKQAQIERQRYETAVRYPAIWAKIMNEWKEPGPDDRAWLMYSANYLFRTEGVRWALDPLTLRQRLPEAPSMDILKDLEGLKFILLTHRHKDHLDLGLVQILSSLPIQWVVPEDMLAMLEQTGLSRARIIVPKPLESILIEGLRIIPFDGLHWERDPKRPEGRRGVPATGYLVEFNRKRWLFPGDTRTYDVCRLPAFGPVDGAFAHLWLGRASALLEEAPLLQSFSRFCIGLSSHRIIVTHLQEFGREATEYWNDHHFKLVRQRLQERAPDIKIESALIGESILL